MATSGKLRFSWGRVYTFPLCRLYVKQYRLIQELCGGTQAVEVKVVAGVTDITDIMDVTDITDVMEVVEVKVIAGVFTDVTVITDVTGVKDITGVTGVADITGGTVRHMASIVWGTLPTKSDNCGFV